MKNNLLSLGQLLEKGYSTKLEQKRLMLSDEKGKLILNVPLSKNRTFKINIQTCQYKCLSAAAKDESWLWHLRYGHLNWRSLQEMSRKKMVYGLPQIQQPHEMCQGCVQAKQPRMNFNQRSCQELLICWS